MAFQPTFDWTKKMPPEAQQRIHDGMKRCDDNADEVWKRVTDACILAVARRCHTFTADHVVAELQKLPDPPTTHNPSALGPRLKEVAKTLKYMEPTDEVRRSTRPDSHGNYLKVWKSLKYEGGNG